MKSKEVMDWNKFEFAITYLVNQIEKSGKKYRAIYGLPRGGLVPAVRLSHALNIPMTFYCGNDLKEIIPDDILVVDDVADTGATLLGYDGFDIATLYFKPQSKVKPKYYCFVTDRWIEFPWEREIK